MPSVLKKIIGVFAILGLVVMVYSLQKPLPPGVHMKGEEYSVPEESVTFLVDQTYLDSSGVRQSDQEIFDEVMRMIANAEQYILVDMFLFNDFQGEPPEKTRALASELTEALVAKKKTNNDIIITVVSDPLNTVYGGAASPHFERLKQHGITVILTDLTKLRDSNPIYAAFWRTFFQWFGNKKVGGLMPHPFSPDGRKVTVRSWLALLNFKANHRKLIVADMPQASGTTKMATLVTSANPHDGSSAHSNIAIKVEDKLWQDAVASEQAVGSFSGTAISNVPVEVEDQDGGATVQLLTEGAIREKLIELTNNTQEGDSLDMAMFYLSERSVIRALASAAQRGVAIRLILDSNKDAFGRTKNGVPNRPVAHELKQKSNNNIQIRWCDTHGEQCHSKLILLRLGGRYIATAGSANLTRRNINDYNLETNVLVMNDSKIPAITRAQNYFDEMWSNSGERTYTTGYSQYADASFFKTVLYRFQEAIGLSSF